MDEHEQEKIQELEMKLHKDHRGVISTSDFQDPEAIYKRIIPIPISPGSRRLIILPRISIRARSVSLANLISFIPFASV